MGMNRVRGWTCSKVIQRCCPIRFKPQYTLCVRNQYMWMNGMKINVLYIQENKRHQDGLFHALCQTGNRLVKTAVCIWMQHMKQRQFFTDQIVLNLIISTLFCIGVVHTGWGRWCIRNFSHISRKWEQYLRLLKPFPSIGDKTAEGRGAELDNYIQLKKTGNYAECECGTCFYTNRNLFQGLWKCSK